MSVRGGRRMSVRILCGWCFLSPFAPEREEDEAKHVGGCQHSGDHADHPQDLMTLDIRLEEDFILAEETGKRRDARNRHRADDERPERDRQLFPPVSYTH